MPRTRRGKPSNDRNPVLHVSSSRDPSKQRTWLDNFLNMPTASKSPSARNMNPTKTQTQTLFAPIRVLNLLPHFDCTGLGSSSHSTKKLSRNIDLCEQQRWHEAMGSENSFEKSNGFVHISKRMRREIKSNRNQQHQHIVNRRQENETIKVPSWRKWWDKTAGETMRFNISSLRVASSAFKPPVRASDFLWPAMSCCINEATLEGGGWCLSNQYHSRAFNAPGSRSQNLNFSMFHGTVKTLDVTFSGTWKRIDVAYAYSSKEFIMVSKNKIKRSFQIVAGLYQSSKANSWQEAIEVNLHETQRRPSHAEFLPYNTLFWLWAASAWWFQLLVRLMLSQGISSPSRVHPSTLTTRKNDCSGNVCEPTIPAKNWHSWLLPFATSSIARPEDCMLWIYLLLNWMSGSRMS